MEGGEKPVLQPPPRSCATLSGWDWPPSHKDAPPPRPGGQWRAWAGRAAAQAANGRAGWAELRGRVPARVRRSPGSRARSSLSAASRLRGCHRPRRVPAAPTPSPARGTLRRSGQSPRCGPWPWPPRSTKRLAGRRTTWCATTARQSSGEELSIALQAPSPGSVGPGLQAVFQPGRTGGRPARPPAA